MPDESPTSGVPRGERDEEPKSKNVKCEFCDCVLFSSGEVKSRSARAKGFQKADEEIERLKEQLQAEKEKVAALETRLRETQETPPTPTPTPVADETPPVKKGVYI